MNDGDDERTRELEAVQVLSSSAAGDVEVPPTDAPEEQEQDPREAAARPKVELSASMAAHQLADEGSLAPAEDGRATQDLTAAQLVSVAELTPAALAPPDVPTVPDNPAVVRRRAPTDERRAHPRVGFSATARCVLSESQTLRCRAHNVSLGGMLLESDDDDEDAPPLGEMLAVRLMERDEGAMELDAEVVRHAPAKGCFGVRFVGLDATQRAFVEALVRLVSQQLPAVGSSGESEYSLASADVISDADLEEILDDDEVKVLERRRVKLEAPIKGGDRVLKLRVAAQRIDWDALDHRAVHVLSLVTRGTLTVTAVVLATMAQRHLGQTEVLQMIADLEKSGIIRSRDVSA